MGIQVRATIIPYLIELERRAADAGIRVQFISGWRSRAHQARLYAAYKARAFQGRPAARPGSSLHETGDAVDFRTWPSTRAAHQTVGAIAKALGFRWGGDFTKSDPTHIDTGGTWNSSGH